MKRNILLFFVLLFVRPSNIYSQNDVLNDSLENAERKALDAIYDSILAVVSNKNVALDVKYELIKNKTEDLSSAYKIERSLQINHVFLNEAKKDANKYYAANMYANIANTYLIKSDLEHAKCYLDSAFLYENKTDSLSSKAMMNYVMSRYYLMIGEEEKGHEYMFKCASYMEHVEGKKTAAVAILYGLADVYLRQNDADEMKKVLVKMIPLADDDHTTQSYVYTYSVGTVYYKLLSDKKQDIHYLDTAMMYADKTIMAYEAGNEMEQNMFKPLIVQHYLNLADIIGSMPEPDWNKIAEYLNMLTDQKNKGAHIGAFDNEAALHRLKSGVLFHEERYNEALAEAKKALDLLEKEAPTGRTSLFIHTYTLLADLYEHQGDYAAALKYTKLKGELQAKVAEERKYDVIKDLQVKYDTAQKDLQISRLNEDKQKSRFVALLIIGFLVVVVIVTFVLFLFNRMKRLRKEKETLLLSKRMEENETRFQKQINQLEQQSKERYILGLEEERTRQAKELHDGVANDVLSIIFQINSGVEKEVVLEKLDETYHNIRNLSHNLIPPMLAYVTLKDILEDYVNKQSTLNRSRLKLHISAEHDWADLPSECALEAYRIIQEAVSNAIKHSNAESISIDVSLTDYFLLVCIADNGKGFDINSPKKGIGLRVMMERTEFMKAPLEIQSELGKGTKVCFRFNTLLL